MNRTPQRPTLSGIILLILALFVSIPPIAFAKRAAVGRPLPAFEARTLKGESLGIAQLKGRVVLIDIWATWCEPCREELPELNALYQELQARGVEIIGISIDRERENVEEFIEKNPIHFPVIHDQNKEIADAFKPRAMPTAFILDQEGVVRHVHLGYKKSYLKKYREQMTELLKNGAKQ